MNRKYGYVQAIATYALVCAAVGRGAFRLLDGGAVVFVLWTASALCTVLGYALGVNGRRAVPPRGWQMLPAQSPTWDVLVWSGREIVTLTCAWMVVWGVVRGVDSAALSCLILGLGNALAQRIWVRGRHRAILP